MALKTATKTVASAGTAERIVSTATKVSSYVIRAMEDNTTNVYIGDSAVANTAPDMQPGEALSWAGERGETEDLNQIFVDSDTSSEGVDVWYIPA